MTALKVALYDRRTYAKITAEMIRAASAGTAKTRIMYSARLNHKQLKRYLDELIERGLLYPDHRRVIFTATDKGKNYLDRYDEIERLKVELEKKLADLDEVFPTSEVQRGSASSKRNPYRLPADGRTLSKRIQRELR